MPAITAAVEINPAQATVENAQAALQVLIQLMAALRASPPVPTPGFCSGCCGAQANVRFDQCANLSKICDMVF
jgi:hypothetical protein